MVTGTVQIVVFHWGPENTACNCVQTGARSSGISSSPGDSGSPIYRIFNNTYVAIGSLSTSNGYFAEIQDALNFWGGAWMVYGS